MSICARCQVVFDKEEAYEVTFQNARYLLCPKCKREFRLFIGNWPIRKPLMNRISDLLDEVTCTPDCIFVSNEVWELLVKQEGHDIQSGFYKIKDVPVFSADLPSKAICKFAFTTDKNLKIKED